MKIAIVGWGVEGQSAYRYFGPEHEYLIANEAPSDTFPVADNVRVQFLKNTGGNGLRGSVKDLSYLDGIEQCDKVIYTPTAVFNLQKKFGDNSSFWKKTATIQHIFFEEAKTKNIIGVTGTKGKGTTSTLIAKMLEAAGHRVYLGSNIGVPVLDFVKDVQPDDWVVLELANFQLKSATYSPHIGVCLTITEEHLDWHPDMEDYVQAKANLFRYQKTDDIAIYFSKNEYSKRIAGYSPGRKVPYFAAPGAYIRKDGMIMLDKTEVMPKNQVKLLGEHNLQNICAALTAVFEATGSVDKAKAVLSGFSGLEHRLEFVRGREGVKYYNDSFSATATATIAALDAIPEPKVLILGGIDRGLDLNPLVESLDAHQKDLRKVLVIGRIAGRLTKVMDDKKFDNYEVLDLKDMPSIVQKAATAAQPGDAVLLSPGAASFDMFKDFAERGEQYKAAVNAL